MKKKKTVLIGGIGEGLGSALADYFASKNYRVIGISRSTKGKSNERLIQFTADLAEQHQVQQTITRIVETYGVPDVYIHNAAELFIAPLEETSAEQFEQCWRAGAFSAFLVAKELLPGMADKGGTAIFTGATASIRGGNRFSAFSAAKFALRGLVQSLARQYQSSGLHIAHILVDGIIDTPRSRERHSLSVEQMLNPIDVAKCYLHLVQQPKSAWTQELDLRPYLENF